MPALHIHLLGDFRLVYAGSLITTFVQARMQALLAYLLIHRASPQPRQQLAFLFWPDTSETQALTNLRQLLHHLRHALPAADQFLQVEPKFVQWRPEASYSLDVADFEHALSGAAAAAKEGRAAVEQTSLEAALQHYDGDLLPGSYEEWILAERERLSQAYKGAIERLVFLFEEQRNYSPATHYAELLLRQDPYHETTYQHLMRLHALNGDRASALRVYHTCATFLERELGVEPNANTREAYQRLLNEEPPGRRHSPPAPSASRPAMVGRHAEWKLLRHTWQRADAGQPGMALISGEAGIGKTRLVEEFLAWAAQQGITTGRTRSYAAEGQLAYAPVIELLRTDPLCSRLADLEAVWLAEVARLMPELQVERPDLPKLGPITDPWQRQMLFEALARAVLGDKGPRMLLFDDLQWCDQDTLEWLHFLLHLDSGARLLVLGSVRPEEIDPHHPLTSLLLDLRLREQLIEIELRPLDADDTAALAEQMTAGKLDASHLARLYSYSEGNPLFVIETIRAEASGGVAEEMGRDTSLDADPQSLSSKKLPAKVQAVIRSRLRQLSPTAGELARLAATIGRAFTFDVLARASESDEVSLVRGLDELWQRRIVREQGKNAYDFSHDRICEVAYAETSPAQRRLLHRQVALALEQVYAAELDTVSGQLAVHYEQAGIDEQAIAYYQQAAGVAQQTFSNAELISLAGRALGLLPRLPDTRERRRAELKMLIMMGTAQMMVKGYGHPEVEATFLRAWELYQIERDSNQTIPVMGGLWICYHLRGDQARALDWAEHLEHEVHDTANAWSHTVAQFALVGAHLFWGNLIAAQRHAEKGLAWYDPQQHPVQSFSFGYEPGIGTLGYWSHNLWLLGYPDQARTKMQEAYKLAYQFNQPLSIGYVLSMDSVLHQLCGEVSLTLERAAATIDYAGEKGMPQWVTHGQIMTGWALARGGQVDRGVELIRQGVAAWKAIGARLALTYYLLLLAETCTTGGLAKEGLEAVAEALAIIEAGGEAWMVAELYRRKGELLLAQGANEPEVESCFERALELARLQQARSFELRATTSLGNLWVRQGRQGEARKALRDIYTAFSEGTDTADLRAAEALLQALA